MASRQLTITKTHSNAHLFFGNFSRHSNRGGIQTPTMQFWRFDHSDPSLGALLNGSHDPAIMVLSVFIGCLAGLTALTLADRMLASPSRAAKALWHAGGSIAMGCGIWAMHFTGMLAFQIDGHPAMHYTLGLTALSLLPAIVGSGASLHVMAQPKLGAGQLLLGAWLIALGIASMHYIGMEAMQMEGLRYDLALFVGAFGVAFLLALGALFLHYHTRQAGSPIRNSLKVTAGIFLGLAVSGMHYTAMGASFFYNAGIPDAHEATVTNSTLAVIIGGVAMLILGLGFLAGWMDRQRATQRTLEHLANTDTLTGLPNRHHFRQLLTSALAYSRRHECRLAVLFLDLNDFKTINDSFGHATGDKLLEAFAKRLAQPMRAEDTAARFGGDEFVVLVRDVISAEDAVQAAERLQHALDEPIEIDGRKLRARASIGISLFPDDSECPEELTRYADAAMYQAKTRRLPYHFFDKGLTRRAKRKVRLGNDLREALQSSQLFLQYQPQVDMNSSRWVGLEALARWRPRPCKLISPSLFVPLAERTGLGAQLSEWALRQACAQGRRWLNEGLEFGRIAVNISATQLERGDFLRRLQTILAETGLPPQHLELELAQPSLLQMNNNIDRLHAIRALDVTLAIDDFGTSHFSLSLLKELPVSKLKIDRVFVHSALQDHRDAAIIHAVVEMADSLGFTTVAEGIEQQAQAALLKRLGCHLGQGYYFARPDNDKSVALSLSYFTSLAAIPLRHGNPG